MYESTDQDLWAAGQGSPLPESPMDFPLIEPDTPNYDDHLASATSDIAFQNMLDSPHAQARDHFGRTPMSPSTTANSSFNNFNTTANINLNATSPWPAPPSNGPWIAADLSGLSQLSQNAHTFGSYRSHPPSEMAESVITGQDASQSVWSGEEPASYVHSDTGLEANMAALDSRSSQNKRKSGQGRAPSSTASKKSKKHTTTVVGNTSFKCNECGLQCRIQSELKMQDCAHSKDGFTTKNDLERHEWGKHSIVGKSGKEHYYKCASRFCFDKAKEWKRIDNFRQHIDRMHKGEDRDDLIKRSTIEYTEAAAAAARSSSTAQPMTINPNILGYAPNNFSFSAPGPSNEAMSWSQSSYPSYEDASALSQLQVGNYAESSYSMDGIHSHPHSYGAYSLDHSSQSASTVQSSAFNSPASSYTTNSLANPIGNNDTKYDLSTSSRRNMGGVDYLRPSQSISLTRGQQQRNRTHSTPMAIPNPHSHEWHSAPPSVDGHYFGGGNSFGSIDHAIHRNVMEDNKYYVGEQEPSSSAMNRHPSQGSMRPNPETQILVQSKQKMQSRKPASVYQNAGNPGPGTRITNMPPPPQPQARNFTCDEETCNESFPTRSALEKHKRRHLRPYACTSDDCPCSKTFGSKYDWKRHEGKAHMLAKEWRCQRCDIAMTFTASEDFVSHLKTLHDMQGSRTSMREVSDCMIDLERGTYWCGFCRDIIDVEENERDHFEQRCSHVALHFHPQRMSIHDWLPSAGDQTKGEIEIEELGEGDAEGDQDQGSSTIGDDEKKEEEHEEGEGEDDEVEEEDEEGDVLMNSVLYSPSASFTAASSSSIQHWSKSSGTGTQLTQTVATDPAISTTDRSEPNRKKEPRQKEFVFKCCQCDCSHIYNKIIDSCTYGAIDQYMHQECGHRFCRECYRTARKSHHPDYWCYD